MLTRRTVLLGTLNLAMGLAGCSLNSASSLVGQEQEPLVVFLVRHAEKVDASADPELSESGRVRADELAKVLRSAKIEQVHSTDYIRTRKTAAPFAASLELDVSFYDPRDLEGFADQLREAGGRHLVVGHSNTTPALVELLGGEAHGPIHEPSEYDRLYIVTIDQNGSANTVLMRYGLPYVPDSDE